MNQGARKLIIKQLPFRQQFFTKYGELRYFDSDFLGIRIFAVFVFLGIAVWAVENFVYRTIKKNETRSLNKSNILLPIVM